MGRFLLNTFLMNSTGQFLNIFFPFFFKSIFGPKMFFFFVQFISQIIIAVEHFRLSLHSDSIMCRDYPFYCNVDATNDTKIEISRRNDFAMRMFLILHFHIQNAMNVPSGKKRD